MKELNNSELNVVAGGDVMTGIGAGGLALGLGTASLGAGWGSLSVGFAFAAAPITCVALVGLAAYAGYQLVSK